MIFEPNEVPKDSWKLWCKEGLALSSRRPVAFVILVLAYGCLHSARLNILFITLIPLFLGAGCVLACCADESTSFVGALRAKPGVVWLRLAIVGAAPWLLLWAFAAFISVFLPSGEPLVIQKSFAASLYEPGETLLALMFIWFLSMGYLLWFAVPLLVIAELPLMQALDQTTDAVSLNRFVITVVVCSSLSTFAGAFCSILAFPWYALVTSMMYASYRHIWLGKGKNQPVQRLLRAESLRILNQG